MTEEEANEIIAENEAMVVGCTYNVLFTNDIVIGKVYEAIVAIKESPLYRMNTKIAIRRVDAERLNYERLSNGIIGERSEFFANANDKFFEEVEDQVNRLHSSIKHELDNNGIKHSEVISKLELARMLCEFGCVQLDKRESELKEKDSRFQFMNIDYLRQTKLLDSLCDTVRMLNIPHVELSTEECTKAINILSVKLADAEIIAKAISA